MKEDYQWINQWRHLFKDRIVLELGCGEGIDTKLLIDSAKSVISTDIDSGNISINKRKITQAQFIELDHSKPLPFENGKFDIVIASLSLHYFTWNKTIEILNEILRVLTAEGTLLCRVNSIEDVNYGASSTPQLEQGMREYQGELKRFFSQNDISQLFREKWAISNLQHCIIDRYSLSKRVWEFTARKS